MCAGNQPVHIAHDADSRQALADNDLIVLTHSAGIILARTATSPSLRAIRTAENISVPPTPLGSPPESSL